MPLADIAPPFPPGKPPELRVLIVDDQWIVRSAIRTALERLDRPFAVIDAETGEEALSIMRNTRISIIFCDIQLPGISGPEALAHAYAGRGDRPFMVLMSGRNSEAAREIGRRIGVYEFLPKPFRSNQVLEAVTAFDRLSTPTRVLLVDDSSVARRLMTRILAKSQFLIDIVEARSGEHAIALASVNRFDVVFLDFNMPGINGVETASVLLQANPKAQIAIISTEQQAKMVKSAQFAGAFAYLRKPFDEKDVDAVLHSAFDLHRPSLARGTHAIFSDQHADDDDYEAFERQSYGLNPPTIPV